MVVEDGEPLHHGEQLDDGGWNCETVRGSRRSSFETTINVLEGLLEHERATGGSAISVAARRRGEEHMLERGLVRRKTTGELIDRAWLRFSFPTRWHYDVLRGLEYFRAVGDPPDERIAEAIDVLRSKRQPDGTWLLENTQPGRVHVAMEDGESARAGGTPSERCVCSPGTSTLRLEPSHHIRGCMNPGRFSLRSRVGAVRGLFGRVHNRG